jgi:cytochrome oxidase assembly protein ShyY1
MVKASTWQWERYKAKVALIESFKENSSADAAVFPATDPSGERYKSLINRKVSLSGEFDYDYEMIVINRRHHGKPGSLLLTPFHIKDSERTVIVSRGWIPFEDRDPSSWKAYREGNSEEIFGVVQEGKQSSIVNPSSPVGYKARNQRNSVSLQRQWLYPDLSAIAAELPYPIEERILIQKLSTPGESKALPAEYVSFRVPPSTHFGYTIEWALLSLASLVIGFLLQAFPSFFFRSMRKTESTEETPSLPRNTIH